MSRSFCAKVRFVFEILRMQKHLVFPSGVFINEAKTSNKNTGPHFSITLKTTYKNSSPFAKIFFSPKSSLTPSIIKLSDGFSWKFEVASSKCFVVDHTEHFQSLTNKKLVFEFYLRKKNIVSLETHLAEHYNMNGFQPGMVTERYRKIFF